MKILIHAGMTCTAIICKDYKKIENMFVWRLSANKIDHIVYLVI